MARCIFYYNLNRILFVYSVVLALIDLKLFDHSDLRRSNLYDKKAIVDYKMLRSRIKSEIKTFLFLKYYFFLNVYKRIIFLIK